MVSIIVPFYEDHNNIKNLLLALKNQTVKSHEIIIIDDHSRNPLINLKNSVNTRVVWNEKNLGPAGSRNIGINLATGDILAFIDSDCIPNNNWIEKICDAFNDENKNIIAGDVKIKTKNIFEYIVSKLGYPAGGNLGFKKMWHVQDNNESEHLSSCNFAIRKKILLEKQLYFDASFPFASCEDVYFSKQILDKNEKIHFLTNNSVFHKPVKNLKSFIKWHFIRGRGAYYLKVKKIGLNKYFYKRIKSLRESLTCENKISFKALLLLIFVLQVSVQVTGYLFQRGKIFFEQVDQKHFKDGKG